MSFLGANVLKGKESVSTSFLANKKVIGLYFSAHWCPPCRGFTPVLAEWYNNFKASHANKDDFELVFVSSDRDPKSFDEYYGEMPWHALPYDQRDIKGELSSKYGVRGIPSLIFVTPSGDVITKDGRSIVMSDPKGEQFPWTPKTFDEMFGTTFQGKDGATVTRDSLAGKYIAIYFSAHWCGPCRGFTPKLADTYKKLKDAGKPFEVIFASSDQDAKAFDEYFAEMPWLAIPYADRARKEELSQHFEVEGIPTLVILGPDGKVVNADGRMAVMADPEGADFPWEPKALSELNSGSAGGLNSHPTLVVFTDGTPEKVAEAKAVLAPIAEAEKADAAAKNREQVFFLYSVDNEEDEMVRNFASLKDDSPQIVLFNIPQQFKARAPSNAVTAENIQAFLDSFHTKTIAKQGLRD